MPKITCSWAIQFILETKLFFREPAAVVWTFVFPVSLLVIWGSLFGGQQEITFKLAVIDRSDSELSRILRKRLSSNTYFQVVNIPQEKRISYLKEGRVDLALIIPSSFGDQKAQGVPHMELLYGNREGYLDRLAGLLLKEEALEAIEGASNRNPSVLILERELGKGMLNPRSDLEYLVPALAAISLVSVSFFSLAVIWTRHREAGKFRHFMVSPLKKWSYLSCKMVNKYCLILLQSAALIGLAHYLYGLSFRANWLVVWMVMTIGAISFMGLGCMLASFSRTSHAAHLLINIVFVLSIFTSGAFFSFEHLNPFWSAISRLLPLNQLIFALRAAMVDGAGFFELRYALALLCVWAAAGSVQALRFLRWD